MTIGAAFQLAKRLRKRSQPRLITLIGEATGRFPNDLVGEIQGHGGRRGALDGESAQQFHDRLLAEAKALGAQIVFIGPSAARLATAAQRPKPAPEPI